MRRLRTTLAAFLLAAPLAGPHDAAQGGAAPEAQAPVPHLDTRKVCLRLADGKLAGSFDYTLVIGTYYEWNTDPTAVPGLMSEVSVRTGVRARVRFSPIGLAEERIRRNPLLIMTGNRFFHLTEAERTNLRKYLLAQGFIYADDCGGADRSFRTMIHELLPEAKLVELDKTHPIFRSIYTQDGPPKILDLYKGPAKAYGAFLHGRLAVLYTYDTDVPCGWERYPDGSFVHLLTKAKHEAAYRFGVNIVVYALQDLYRRRIVRSAPAAKKPVDAAGTMADILPGKLRTYRMKPLMPCNLIRAIAPAGRYVWIGGRRTMPGEQEGLARYDYQTDSWQMMLDSEGVLADEINCLAADGQGLWIGTSTIRQRWNYGLWYYDPGTRRGTRYTTKQGLVDIDVYDLALRGDDLWIATRSGLARYNRKTRKWSRDPTHCRTYVDLALCVAAGDAYVWFGRANGLRRYDRRRDAYETFDATNSPIDGMVDTLVEDGPRLWISNPPKLLVYEKGRFSAAAGTDAVTAAEILAGAADRQAVCFGTRRGGLHVLDKASGKWTTFDKASGLPCDCISRLALDPRSIWCALGQDPLGVGRYDRKLHKWSFYTHRAGIPCDHIFSLACDGSDLYVGTMANGFWKYDNQTDRWRNLNLAHRAEHTLVPRGDVYTMLRIGRTLWLGTNQGLCRYEMGAETYQIVKPQNAAVAVLAVDAGRIVCGTKQKGLLAYDPRSGGWTDLNRVYGLRPRAITALACAPARVWIGTEEGLVGINSETNAHLVVSAELADVPVTALLLQKGDLWVGTPRGLFRYQPGDGKVTRFGTEAGLPSESITSLMAYPTGMLVGTRSGLALMSGAAREIRTEKRLSGHHINSLTRSATHLWIGTLGQGLVRAGLPEVR